MSSAGLKRSKHRRESVEIYLSKSRAWSRKANAIVGWTLYFFDAAFWPRVTKQSELIPQLDTRGITDVFDYILS
jgi:hypothetical protein